MSSHSREISTRYNDPVVDASNNLKISKTENNKSRRVRLESVGLCVICGKYPPKTGIKMCSPCQIKSSKRSLERRRKLASISLCVSCGSNSKRSDSKYCISCSERRSIQCKLRRVKDRATGRCSSCGTEIDDTGTQYYCGKCRTERRNYVNNKLKKAKENCKCLRCGKPTDGQKARCWGCSFLEGIKHRKWYRDLKKEVLRAYGNGTAICNCCGETILEFLQIDHIDGNGRKHRRSIKAENGGANFYYWLKKNNYPPGFQVLCANCNLAKHLCKGTCPHKRSSNFLDTLQSVWQKTNAADRALFLAWVQDE